MSRTDDFEPIIPTQDDAFYWPVFHRFLDRAVAAYIEDGGRVTDPIINLARYSNGRAHPPTPTSKEEIDK